MSIRARTLQLIFFGLVLAALVPGVPSHASGFRSYRGYSCRCERYSSPRFTGDFASHYRAPRLRRLPRYASERHAPSRW